MRGLIVGAFLIPVVAAATSSFAGANPPYRLGGPVASLQTASGSWAWQGGNLTGFRDAVQNPANFGPAGTVATAVQVVDLAAVNSSSLAGVDGFVSTWWQEGQSAPFHAAVVEYFLNGGDLFLLNDSSDRDGIATAIAAGLATSGSNGTNSSGDSPLGNGPFGLASAVRQFGDTGQLSAAAITASGGFVGLTNAAGQITAAYWPEGAFGPNSGRLVIAGDIDMIATTTADYTALNDNARFALNSVAYLVPSPGALGLLAGAGLLAARRRR
jgi:hypothetical protein